MSFRSELVAQFARPRGILGALAGWVMANRPSNVERNRWSVDLLDVRPDDRVLEIGCGPGLALAYCVAKLEGGHVVGIDHSEVMIAAASKRNAAAIKGGALELVTGSIDRLPTLGLTFTKALAVNVAQFFPDKTALFSAIAAVMAPNGLIAATSQPRTAKPTHADALRMASAFSEAMTDAGFADIRCEILPVTPASAICVLGRKLEYRALT
jgi:trans-aconitate methyltransferase